MSDAASLEANLRRFAPGVWRCLSPLGRAAAFPRGITWQGEQARTATVNATIGQTTDGFGKPLALPFVSDGLNGLDEGTSFLYGPVEGPRPLREAWLSRQRRLAGGSVAATGLSMTTHGLTNSLSVVASLFADPDTDVLIPDPCWDSYELILGLYSRAHIVPFPTHQDGRFSTDGLAAALVRCKRKAVLVLNFPGNPTGYMPSVAEAEEITQIVVAHPGPLVVVTDDAYQGWVYESGRARRSLFWDLAERADPERLVPIKVDGATKELVFFASRIGFVTPSIAPDAADALESKVKYVLRATVGCPSGPAVALVHRALKHPSLDEAFAARVDVLKRRWSVLREQLRSLEGLVDVTEFNSAFFALIGLRGRDPEGIRASLLTNQSLGTIAYPNHGALRVAFCSISEQRIPELVDRLGQGLRATS